MPWIRTARLENFALMVEDNPFYFRLNVEIRRHAGQPIDNDLQRLRADNSSNGRARVFRLEDSSRFFELRLLVSLLFLECFYIIQRHFESKLKFRFERGGIVLIECASPQQLPFV